MFQSTEFDKTEKRANQPHSVTSMKSHSSDFKFKEITSESETIGRFAVLFWQSVWIWFSIRCFECVQGTQPSTLLSHLSPHPSLTSALLSTAPELTRRVRGLPKVPPAGRRADAFCATEPSSVDFSQDAPKWSTKSLTGFRVFYFERSIPVVLICGVRSQRSPRNDWGPH